MSRFSKPRNDNAKNLTAGIIIVSALCFMLFFYAPLELYFYNQDDFWFDLYNLLPVVLLLFSGSLLVSAAAVSLIHLFFPRLYRLVLSLCCIAFLCTYIQGNFMVKNLPPLDGTEIIWANYSSGRIQSVILWIVITVFICVLLKIFPADRFCKMVNVFGICMILMLLVSLVSICAITKGYVRKLDAAISRKNEFVMSADTNFIILLLDAIDSETLYNMLETHPEYRETFEDFTYYPNTMGVYPFTMHSVPYILSGEWHENQVPFQEYNVNVYKNSAFLRLLEEKGYELDIYEDELPLLDRSIFRLANVLDIQNEITSYADFAKLEIKLTGFRYAPFDLKRQCVFNTNRFNAVRSYDDAYPFFSSNNWNYYHALQEGTVTRTEQKTFKLIHIEGAHVPFQYDKEVNYIDDATYESNIEASMTIADAYLEKLREAGVYDNSIIIVMADHGYSLAGPAAHGRQNPIFFVKGLEESHEMNISDAPISYEDLQEAFRRLLDGKPGTEISDYREGDQRERRYLYYIYEFDEHMEEYLQKGHAFDDDTMEPTGNLYTR